MWRNIVVRQASDDSVIRRMRIACWIYKATDTHSECIIFIVFPLQQWLHERASMLRCTYTTCLVLLNVLTIESFYFVDSEVI